MFILLFSIIHLVQINWRQNMNEDSAYIRKKNKQLQSNQLKLGRTLEALTNQIYEKFEKRQVVLLQMPYEELEKFWHGLRMYKPQHAQLMRVIQTELLLRSIQEQKSKRAMQQVEQKPNFFSWLSSKSILGRFKLLKEKYIGSGKSNQQTLKQKNGYSSLPFQELDQTLKLQNTNKQSQQKSNTNLKKND